MSMILPIAAGGAVGALSRHFLGGIILALLGTGFPYATLIVNILGGFFMGVFVEGSALLWTIPLPWRAFITVGLLGGFTTFSTFSLETVLLFQRGETFNGLVYVAGSLIASVLALVAGMYLVRLISA